MKTSSADTMVLDEPKKEAAASKNVKPAVDSRAGAASSTAVKESTIYIDGKFYPESDAKISVFDHGLLYGDGVFEGIRFYNGRVFRLDEHLERLEDSARAICLTLPIDRGEMK